MWIMIAGPYTHGTTDELTRAKNHRILNEYAYQVFNKGHIPIIGVNLVVPIIEAVGKETFDELMMPLSLAVAEKCDAVLRIGGESFGADQEVESFRKRGLDVYFSVEEIPGT